LSVLQNFNSRYRIIFCCLITFISYYTQPLPRVYKYALLFPPRAAHVLWGMRWNKLYKTLTGGPYCVSFSPALQPLCSPTVVSTSCLVPEFNMSGALSADSKYAMKFRSRYLVIRPDCIPVPKLRRAYL